MVSVAAQQALSFAADLPIDDVAPTPGFFTSLFGTDAGQEGSNPFDAEFSAHTNDVNLSSAHLSSDMSSAGARLEPSLPHAHPSSQQLMPSRTYAYADFSTAQIPSVPTLLTDLPYSHSQFGDPQSQFLLHAFSPPESVHHSPVEWPYPTFSSSQLDKHVHPTLPPLLTQTGSAIHSAFGQATPPDDVASIHDTAVEQVPSSERSSLPPQGTRKRGRRRSSTPMASPTPALAPTATTSSITTTSSSTTTTNKSSSTKPARRARRTARGRPSKLSSSAASANAEAPNLEDAKRAKFLERNRVAASKCRQKKKAWTRDIEVQARELQATARQQEMLLDALHEERRSLKEMLLKHARCGDEHVEAYLALEARWVAQGGERKGEEERRAGRGIERKSAEATATAALPDGAEDEYDVADDDDDDDHDDHGKDDLL